MMDKEILNDDIFDEDIPEAEENELGMYWLNEYELQEFNYIHEHPEVYKLHIDKADWGLTPDGHFRDGGILFLNNIECKLKHGLISSGSKLLEIELVENLIKCSVITLDDSYLNTRFYAWKESVDWQELNSLWDESSKERETDLINFLYDIDAEKVAEEQEKEQLESKKKMYDEVIATIKKDFNR